MKDEFYNAIYSFGLCKGQLEFYPYSNIISQLIMVDEVKCHFAIEGEDYSCEDIITSIYSKQSSVVKIYVEHLLAIEQIIQTGCEEFTILLPSHYGKIQYEISGIGDLELEQDTIFANDLIALYCEENKYLSIQRLEEIVSKNQLHSICLQILVHYVVDGTFAINQYQCSRTLIRLKGKRLPIVLFLQDMAKTKLSLLHSVSNTMLDMNEKLQTCIFYSKKLEKLLSDNLVLSNKYVVDELGVTAKTAILYLKTLEQVGILKSVKRGREKLYINSSLLHVLEALN